MWHTDYAICLHRGKAADAQECRVPLQAFPTTSFPRASVSPCDKGHSFLDKQHRARKSLAATSPCPCSSPRTFHKARLPSWHFLSWRKNLRPHSLAGRLLPYPAHQIRHPVLGEAHVLRRQRVAHPFTLASPSCRHW